MISELKKILSKTLCPAGDGVFTVKTAENLKSYVQKKLYQDLNKIEENWLKKQEKINQHNLPLILGVCSDTGGGILRGANWGPLAIREELYKKIATQNVHDLGDVRIIPHLLHDKYLNQETINSCRQALYNDLKVNYPVSPLSLTEYVLQKLYFVLGERKIISFGGDHSISFATTSAFLKNQNQLGKRSAVLHFDAHTDLLPERLGIDLNFGTWAYNIISLLKEPSDLIQIGIRSSKYDKQYWQQKLGVQQYWSSEVNTLGAEAVSSSICKYLKKNKIENIFISFDIDAIDENYVSATGTPEPNGLIPKDAIYIIEKVLANFSLGSADIMEVAPFTGINLRHNKQDKTVAIAAELAKLFIQESISVHENSFRKV